MDDKRLTVSAPADVEAGADVRGLVDAWRRSLELRIKAGELARSTATTYWAGTARFLGWAENAGAVTDDTIREWKAALLAEGHKPGSVNTWLAGVRAFFTWAVAARRLTYNPAAGVPGATRKGTSTHHKRDTLTDDEVRRVLAIPDRATAAGARDRAILYLMAYTAARTVEVHRADLGDLQTKAGQLVLHVQGKGHSEADELIVIAHPDAAGALHDWLAHRGAAPGPLFTSLSQRNRAGRLSLPAIRALVKAAYRAAGVLGANKTTHSLRHTAISNAIRHGAPVQKAQAMARHANIQTTMIYYHEADRVEDPAERYINYNGKGR